MLFSLSKVLGGRDAKLCCTRLVESPPPHPWIFEHTRRSCYSVELEENPRVGGLIVWKEGIVGFWEGWNKRLRGYWILLDVVTSRGMKTRSMDWGRAAKLLYEKIERLWMQNCGRYLKPLKIALTETIPRKLLSNYRGSKSNNVCSPSIKDSNLQASWTTPGPRHRIL